VVLTVLDGLEVFWKYVDKAMQRKPRNRLLLGWMSSTTHTPFLINPKWKDDNFKDYIEGETSWDTVNGYLNAIRWTDDKVKEIILGFRERGLENETLFVMYPPLLALLRCIVKETMASRSLDNGPRPSKIPTTKLTERHS